MSIRGHDTIFIKHELKIPLDPEMTTSIRFRYLIKHHRMHSEIYNSTLLQGPPLTNNLETLRNDLAAVADEEAQLVTAIEKIDEKDRILLSETAIVAKHRLLLYNKKRDSLYRIWRREERRIIAKLEVDKAALAAEKEASKVRDEMMNEFAKESAKVLYTPTNPAKTNNVAKQPQNRPPSINSHRTYPSPHRPLPPLPSLQNSIPKFT